jgi:hypothetical protein
MLRCRTYTALQVRGFKRFNDANLEYSLLFPSGWILRENSSRPGIYASDFQTADKLVVEVFTPVDDTTLAAAAVSRIVSPGDSAAGDSRLDTPSLKRVVQTGGDGVFGSEPLRLAFTSETITRSGYQVRRKHVASVTRARDGRAFVVAASARADLCDADKETQLRTIVDSFVLL